MHQPMNANQEQLLAAARTHVTRMFNEEGDKRLVFHSLEHTEDVVEACSLMADHFNLNDEDRLVLSLAAWFHDTGYLGGQPEGHEEASVQVATAFLQQHGVEEAIIQRVVSAIRATRMPQSPISLVEQILCDADMMHLSTTDFKPRNALLKAERENFLQQKISNKDWRKSNREFLQNHHYFTDYGKQLLEPRKQANLQELLKKKDRKAAEAAPEKSNAPAGGPFPYVSAKELKVRDAKEAKETERGVQTMFRTTSSNHFELSSLADGKANIMISVNAIIISVVLTVLLVRLPFYPQYLVPTIVLMATCLGAMIFAILATRPSVNQGTFTEDDIRQKRTNLLFFGNFYRVKLEEYQWGMNQMLKDKEYLYNSMIKDIYFLGIVLAKKYRLLRIAYTIFMWGLIATVIAFAVASLISDSGTSAVTEGTRTVIDY
jgi:predicted metal-dependent HD superfamily phosphohydrolase